MMQDSKPKMKKSKRITVFILFALCALLLVLSIAGYVLRPTAMADRNLHKMSTAAVLNAATDGLVEKIAASAKADKLKEIRKRDDFRQMGTAAVTALCEEAERTAREEAKLRYALSGNVDTSVLEENIQRLQDVIKTYEAALEGEQASYSRLYNEVLDSVPSFMQLIEGKDDAGIWAALCDATPALRYMPSYEAPFVTLAKDRADLEAKQLEQSTEESADAAVEEDVVETAQVDFKYFVESAELKQLDAQSEEAFTLVWAELLKVTPDLETLDKKTRNSIEDTVMGVAASVDDGFADRYGAYAEQNAESVLSGADRLLMLLAYRAETLFIAFIALILLTVIYAWWKPLTDRLGVPRTIILLFFIYLLLAARMYGMNINTMFSNVLERVGMYGILVLAMLPGIQCGIGLNMGVTIGCVSGLFAIIVTLQYNMSGIGALFFACILGALVALPLGWAYSLLLNRMKGSEMTISTYVGYSFVSLMCIGWLLLPFYNPRIVFPLRGSGMRVTHSLLGVYAHTLDNLGALRIGSLKIPTGLLLFFLLMCLLLWVFSRSKMGIAMSAVGSNRRFAEASGVNVDHMRTLGTVLSMMIAAVGIVVYSSAFGYAQLYNAPKQLGFITASAILIGGASVRKARVSHVIIGVFLFEGVLTLGQQVANAAVSGGGLSEVMRIMISNGIILYALTQSGGEARA